MKSIDIKGIDMKKRMKDYLEFLQNLEIDNMPLEKREQEAKNVLVQLGFFQHERLIHLIVTVMTALLTMMSLIIVTVTESLYAIIMLLLLSCLLVSYLWHYYILENGTQQIYEYYDKLKKW